jgi:hypothetical protein
MSRSLVSYPEDHVSEVQSPLRAFRAFSTTFTPLFTLPVGLDVVIESLEESSDSSSPATRLTNPSRTTTKATVDSGEAEHRQASTEASRRAVSCERTDKKH